LTPGGSFFAGSFGLVVAGGACAICMFPEGTSGCETCAACNGKAPDSIVPASNTRTTRRISQIPPKLAAI
jgi:hypothetical protein